MSDIVGSSWHFKRMCETPVTKLPLGSAKVAKSASWEALPATAGTSQSRRSEVGKALLGACPGNANLAF